MPETIKVLCSRISPEKITVSAGDDKDDVAHQHDRAEPVRPLQVTQSTLLDRLDQRLPVETGRESGKPRLAAAG